MLKQAQKLELAYSARTARPGSWLVRLPTLVVEPCAALEIESGAEQAFLSVRERVETCGLGSP